MRKGGREGRICRMIYRPEVSAEISGFLFWQGRVFVVYRME